MLDVLGDVVYIKWVILGTCGSLEPLLPRFNSFCDFLFGSNYLSSFLELDRKCLPTSDSFDVLNFLYFTSMARLSLTNFGS